MTSVSRFAVTGGTINLSSQGETTMESRRGQVNVARTGRGD
jgi:hypothetical protein